MSLTKAERKALTQELLSDREAIEGVLSKIAAGMSLRDICMIEDYIYSTVQLRLTTDPELRPLYEAARTRQAEAVLDEIKEIEERLEGGEGRDPIDPKAAAVLIGSKQWRAARLNPKRYGERTFQHIETVDQTKLHLEALRAIGAQRVAAIDVTPARPQLEQLPATTIEPELVEDTVASTQPGQTASPYRDDR